MLAVRGRAHVVLLEVSCGFCTSCRCMLASSPSHSQTLQVSALFHLLAACLFRPSFASKKYVVNFGFGLIAVCLASTVRRLAG